MKETLLIKKTWLNVFSNWKYLMLAIIIAFAFYLINAIILQWKNIVSFGLNFSFLFSGIYYIVTLTTFVNLLILSVLTGLLITLLVYRWDNIGYKGKIGFFPSIGLFLGIFVPGCATCGIGLAASLGIASSLAVLPFKGAEISYLAMAILLLSIINLSLKLSTESCRLND